MPSVSEPLDWAPPWRIDRPAGEKPAPGPELDVWLQQRLLYRTGRSLKDTLDRIDPAIARNESVAALDEEAVMVAILEFLETPSLHGREEQAKWRLPQHMAQAYLAYFVRGFRQYCASHHLRLPRLPLASEFSLDFGLLTADTFTALNEYRQGVQSLCKHLAESLRPPEQLPDLSPQEIAALIVASAALFGGLPHRLQWESLVSALQYPPRHDGAIIWFLFDSPNKMRWIADPVTEALLRRFWRIGLLPLSVPIALSVSRINRLLGFSDKQASSTRPLKAAVEAMHARHFAPDVASVVQGLIENTRLDEEPWLRLISGMREQCPRKKIALSMPKAPVSASADTIEKVRLGQLIEKIGAAVNWNPGEIRKAGQGSRVTDAKAKFFANAKTSLKAIELELARLFERSGRRGADRNSFAYGLKCYADDLIMSGGLKRSTLAPATISNYVSIVKNHLARLHFEDLALLPTETREEAYRTAIASQMIRGQNSYRTAFEGFERSILRHLDVEDQIDWTAIRGRARPGEMPPVDANLIDPILFRHSFDSLGLIAETSSHQGDRI